MSNSIYDVYFNWQNNPENIVRMKELIIGHSENFEPDILASSIHKKLIELNISTVLDYGAGLGRNLSLLKKYSNQIDYLDLLNYEKNYSDYIKNLGYNEIYYVEIIPNILSKKYDLIYASVVLQHIVDNEIYSKIVEILATKCKYLLLIQNENVLVKPIFYNFFDLIYTEDYVGSFPSMHIYSIYTSKI
jgi:SAM-dependent methyltransferase